MVIKPESTIAKIKVMRVGGAEGEITCKFITIPDTAQPVEDFTSVDGFLIFPYGVNEQFIEISIAKKSTWGESRRFFLQIEDFPSDSYVLEDFNKCSVTIMPEHDSAVRMMFHRYSLHLLKFLAGLVRLLLEDILNLFVQFCILVKFWDDYGTTMRAFTIMSMAAGIICSGVGPLQDVWGLYTVKAFANEKGFQAELKVQQSQPNKVGRVDYRPIAQEESLLRAEQLKEELAEQVERLSSSEVEIELFPRKNITDFIADTGELNAIRSHRLLIVCAIIYWGGMALIPLIFWESIIGGIDASVPVSTVLYFTIICIVTLVPEFWVAIQTYEGFMLIKNCHEHLARAFSCNTESWTLGATLLSCLARYDTFSDVIMTVILCKTEAITYLHFKHTLHIEVFLPIELHKISLFSIVVGVFGFQALPGIIFLIRKRYLTAAFKLNEFNFLLGMLECEAESSPEMFECEDESSEEMFVV